LDPIAGLRVPLGKKGKGKEGKKQENTQPNHRLSILQNMETLRLSPEMARSFLLKLSEHIERNVNIMDRDGRIIASRDPARQGQYHEAAFRLIQSAGELERIEETDDLPPGVKPGVNLPIRHGTEVIGVVGITGKPQEVLDLAYAVKTSIEAMVELETVKERLLRRQSGRQALIQRLIQTGESVKASTTVLMTQLGYDPQVYRIPILLIPPRNQEPEDLWRELKNRGIRSPQDIGAPDPEGALLIFKEYSPPPQGILRDLERTINEFAQTLSAETFGSLVFAGMVQKNCAYYPPAYRQVLWLRSRFLNDGSSSRPSARPILVADHVEAYLRDLAPPFELAGLFGALQSLVPPDLGYLRTSLGVLESRNFNMKETAQKLGIHRNTLAGRLDKFQELWGIDIRDSNEKRLLFRYFTWYN
jgi:carbohydrate diacid regulator